MMQIKPLWRSSVPLVNIVCIRYIIHFKITFQKSEKPLIDETK